MSAGRGKLIALGLGVALTAGFLWSQRPHPRHAAEPTGGAALSVRVTELREQPVALFSEAIGSLRSRDQVVISSRLAAHVRSVAVTAGSAVASGELLIELESAGLEARVDSAQAALEVAEQVLAESRREEQRTRALFARQARTQQELDTAATRLAAAVAGRAAAAGALAAAESAQGDALLRAPFAGVVGSRSVDPGDLALPGRTLLELYDPSALRLEVALPERLLGRLAVGATIGVRIDSLPGPSAAGLEVAGRVEEINSAIDPATRTAHVKIALPEMNGALPGMFGRARLPEAERLALVVPQQAVVQRGQLQLVFTVSADGRQAEMHLVRTGRPLADGGVEILAGLSGVQQVVTSGAQALRDGAPIRVDRGAPERR